MTTDEATTEQHLERETRFPWEVRARLKGAARVQAIAFLLSLNQRCYFCKLPIGYGAPDVHHIDENPRENHLVNLALSHHGCNSSDFNSKKTARTATSHPTREREINGMAVASSEETRRALTMRPRWNNWIDSKPFVQINMKKLAKRAPHILGIGSSITYTRYIEEDIEGGIFTLFEIEGVPQIRLNPEVDTRMIREQREREGKRFDAKTDSE